MASKRLISHLPLHHIIIWECRILFFKTKTVGCGAFIISTSHVLRYAHYFAIVDESCTLLPHVHVASPYVDRRSFLAPRTRQTAEVFWGAGLGRP